MLKYLLQHYFKDSFINCKDETAIKQGNRLVLYSELENMVNAISAYFVENGYKNGDKVGILSPVSPEIIAVMIACLKQGIIYVPLNVFAPTSWIKKVVDKAGLHSIIIDEKFDQISEEVKFSVPNNKMLKIKYSDTKQSICSLDGLNILENSSDRIHSSFPNILADDLACILFTSGSTGDPKGIMISHRNLFTFTEWMKEFFKITQKDKVFSRAPLQFDLSEFDIFTTLSAGGTIVIAPRDFSEDPVDIVQLMNNEEITVIYTVPSAYIRLLNKGKLERNIASLRLALYAGEPFPPPYLRKVMNALPDTKFWNIYGPTETNIVTYYNIPEPPRSDDPIPIGKAVDDTDIVIVDESLNVVKDGVVGEILVRGGTVFKGYLGNKELSKERLIECDWHNSLGIFCRTGDLGKILSDGNIAYHGRMDNMVKTRGYRVEIDEVENALSSIKGVAQATVVPVSHKDYTNALHAFIQITSASLTLPYIEKLLKDILPSYMIPLSFYQIDEFPKTSTAKIDRVRLKEIATNAK